MWGLCLSCPLVVQDAPVRVLDSEVTCTQAPRTGSILEAVNLYFLVMLHIFFTVLRGPLFRFYVSRRILGLPPVSLSRFLVVHAAS